MLWVSFTSTQVQILTQKALLELGLLNLLALVGKKNLKLSASKNEAHVLRVCLTCKEKRKKEKIKESASKMRRMCCGSASPAKKK
jgi:hypothetical protein